MALVVRGINRGAEGRREVNLKVEFRQDRYARRERRSPLHEGEVALHGGGHTRVPHLHCYHRSCRLICALCPPRAEHRPMYLRPRRLSHHHTRGRAAATSSPKTLVTIRPFTRANRSGDHAADIVRIKTHTRRPLATVLSVCSCAAVAQATILVRARITLALYIATWVNAKSPVLWLLMPPSHFPSDLVLPGPFRFDQQDEVQIPAG